jgi:ubiquinone biosynthesis protein COQ9
MTPNSPPEDLTLDELRLAMAPEIAVNAAFDGWGDEARDFAADAAGVDRDVAALAFKDGATQMIDAWFASVDLAMVAAYPPERIAAMKIRERIAGLVEARLDLLAPDRESLRRALAVLAMPQNLGVAARLGWRSADAIWRAAGDVATDYNHYTKRAILGTVYAATIQVFLNDDSEDHADTRAFLARRIEGILRFEKVKAQWLGRASHRPSLSRFVSRLRYPAV